MVDVVDLICYDIDLIAFSFEHSVCFVHWLFSRASEYSVLGNPDTN